MFQSISIVEQLIYSLLYILLLFLLTTTIVSHPGLTEVLFALALYFRREIIKIVEFFIENKKKRKGGFELGTVSM